MTFSIHREASEKRGCCFPTHVGGTHRIHRGRPRTVKILGLQPLHCSTHVTRRAVFDGNGVHVK